eukprot:139149_1
MSSNGLRVGVAVLLNNGYSGVIKYVCHDHLQLLFGIELQQPIMVHEFMNGHNGTIGNEELFVPLNCIVTTLDDNGIDSEPRYTLKIKNDTIYFPIISEDPQITQKKPKKDENEPQRNDIVQLTDGRLGTFSYIGRSVRSNALYCGVTFKQKQSGDRKAEMVWICRKDICMHQFSSNQLQNYVNMCYSDNARKCLLSVSNIRRLLCVCSVSDKNKTISAVVDSGVVKRLIQFLESGNNVVLQHQSSWALANIASGTDAHTLVLVRCGAIPLFVKLLKSASDGVKQHCMHALSNIAGTSSAYRDMMLLHGILIHLVPLFDIRKSADFLGTATWTLSNLCRPGPVPKREDIVVMNTALAIMITSDDHDILLDTLWAFSYLSDNEGELIFDLIKNESLNHIICLLGHESAGIRKPALRILGNFVAGPDHHTRHLITCDVLKKLKYLIMNDDSTTRREACWMISNIIVCDLQAVIDAKLMPVLSHLLDTASVCTSLERQVIWAICNAVDHATYEQNQPIQYLMNSLVLFVKKVKTELSTDVLIVYNQASSIFDQYFNNSRYRSQDTCIVNAKPTSTCLKVGEWTILQEGGSGIVRYIGTPQYVIKRNRLLIDGFTHNIERQLKSKIIPFQVNGVIVAYLNAEYVGIELDNWSPNARNGTVGNEVVFTTEMGKSYFIETQRAMNTIMNSKTPKSRVVTPMIGTRVRTQNGLYGVVKYVGTVEFRWSVRLWFGIELDSWNINGNNGIIKSKKYFDTEDGRGYFVQLKHLVMHTRN